MISVLFCLWVVGSFSDLVTEIPKFGQLNETAYSGYISVDNSHDSHLYYFFIEARSEATVGVKSDSIPVILWLNGGPGASSLTGQFTENGPFGLDVIDGSPFIRKHAWTNIGHMLFIDNPVGSGYSYTDDTGYVKTEIELRKQFYLGLQGFFDRHPIYRKNPFYLSGESYAGKYLPHIAYEIVQQNKTFPIRVLIWMVF
eukprot:UN27397